MAGKKKSSKQVRSSGTMYAQHGKQVQVGKPASLGGAKVKR